MIDESMARSMRALPEGHHDVTQTAKEVIVTIELPGVDKNDIEIDASEDGIAVEVESKKEKEVRKEGMYKAGSRYFGFRSFYTTPPIDPKSVTAGYKNGVLEIKAKKLKPAKKGNKVKVK